MLNLLRFKELADGVDAADGISGADLMSVIMSAYPETDPGKPEPWKPRPRGQRRT